MPSLPPSPSSTHPIPMSLTQCSHSPTVASTPDAQHLHLARASFRATPPPVPPSVLILTHLERRVSSDAQNPHLAPIVELYRHRYLDPPATRSPGGVHPSVALPSDVQREKVALPRNAMRCCRGGAGVCGGGGLRCLLLLS